MSTPFPLFPPSASTVALEMDLLYLHVFPYSERPGTPVPERTDT